MNHLTLDYLEELTYTKREKKKFLSFLHEIKIFALIFGFAFFGVTIFTNANVFMASLTDTLHLGNGGSGFDAISLLHQNNSISNIMHNQAIKDAEVNAIIAQYSGDTDIQDIAKDQNQFLSENLKSYQFDFNTLPPSNRLIIPKFDVNDPIIISQFTNMDEFIYKNYNEELKKGVVKYPTTPAPGQSGNTLIFGHTSQEWRKQNQYGMAFAHIAQMQKGDKIEVVWDGTLYEYKVVDIQVQYPDKVHVTYDQYAAKKDHNYLTLMGCYPIGTSKQRMLVVAEQVSRD
ncbi:MAG: class E sortase [Candidatus Absconditabacteria bacterium]